MGKKKNTFKAILSSSPKPSFPYYSEELLWRNMVFSTVRTKNIKQVRDTVLQGLGKKKKKNTSTYIVNHYGHGTWEGNLIEGEPALHPGKGAFNLNC